MVSHRTLVLVLLSVIYLVLPMTGQAKPQDTGIFTDLNTQVSLRVAPWLATHPHHLYLQKKYGQAVLVIDGIPALNFEWSGGPIESLKSLFQNIPVTWAALGFQIKTKMEFPMMWMSCAVLARRR